MDLTPFCIFNPDLNKRRTIIIMDHMNLNTPPRRRGARQRISNNVYDDNGRLVSFPSNGFGGGSNNNFDIGVFDPRTDISEQEVNLGTLFTSLFSLPQRGNMKRQEQGLCNPFHRPAGCAAGKNGKESSTCITNRGASFPLFSATIF